MTTREEIMTELKNLGISFPDTATIMQLREMLKNVIGDNAANNTSTAAASASAEVATETETDILVRHLENKMKILRLQKEVEELEEQKDSKRKTTATFADIEGALPKFSGDNEENILKWVQEFEKVTEVVGCTSAEKFLFARRMMAGSAILFMRTSVSRDWPGFKEELCAEFKRDLGAKEILKKLESRVWRKGGESLHRYVLIMQQIAEDAPISEAEKIEYIVEGLRDKSPAASIFYNVTSIAEFKNLIPRYEKLMDNRVMQSGGAMVALQDVRCFNCSEFGHYATNCQKEKRQAGSCFKCGKMGHLKAHCPVRAVATVPNHNPFCNVKPL
ncbi:uncharacterized protein [Musca autumnalis]|uniref:uncharacterized protein n=1 Tax=Musca autumnalis TaxID=221902 RepID=UPI003CF60F00